MKEGKYHYVNKSVDQMFIFWGKTKVNKLLGRFTKKTKTQISITGLAKVV